MAKFRKKVTVVDAVQVPINFEDCPEWIVQARASGQLWAVTDGSLRVKTNHGTTVAKTGDWVIRQPSGEVYPCNAEIFEASYEAVE